MRYAFCEFVLDTVTGELRRSDETVVLRRQTFRLLQLLVERAPALMPHNTLLDEVWGRTALSPNAVPQAISELRRALGDDPQSPRFIETRHRLGYRFLAPVRRDEAADTAGTTALSDSAKAASTASTVGTDKRKPWPVHALWLTCLLLVGWLTLRSQIGAEGDMGSAAAASRRSLALAVFPAEADVPPWVAPIALELLAQRLSDSPLRLLRSDVLGVAGGADATRWPQQAHDLFAAESALIGHWRRGSDGSLALDYDIIDLIKGGVIERRTFTGQAEELGRIVAEATSAIALALDLQPAAANAEEVRISAEDAAQYWNGLSAVRAGQGEQAAVALSDLHARLQHPAWVEATLTEAYVQAGDRDAAIDLLEARLERGQDLPLGERLRLQARVATLRYKPVVAAAVYRALVDLDSDDVESGIRLIESEVDALLGDSARKSLAQLAALPTTRNDPRLILLRSRIASLDSDFELALREAAAVAQVALRHDLPSLGVSAALAEAAALNAQGRLDEAARLLAESDRLWSGRVGSEVLLDLRMRRVRLLRELGRLADSQQVLDTLQSEFTGPLPRARMGIEAALLRLATARVDEADAVLRQIKPAIHRSGDANLVIAWLNAAAIAAIARNAPDSAGQLFAQAFAMARENGLAGRHVALQVNAGTALMRQKRSVEADEQWQQALETFEALGDRRGQAICLGNLAASASIQGKLERSVELNTRALALFRELHLSGSQARTAYNLALAATRDGSLDQARSYFREAGEVWQANGSADLAMRAAIGQAEIELIRGEFDAAERVMAALGHTAPASPLTASHALAMKARISLAQGKLVESRQLHEQALALRKQDGNEGWITLSELELLRNDLLAGRDPVAIQIAAESLARRFAGLGEVRDEARAWLLVVDAQLSLHRRDDARRSLERVKMANRIFGDRMVAFDLEWAVAWASDREERTLRLRALRQRASDEGYLAQSARAGWALQAGEANEDSAWKTHSVTLPPYARAGATIP